MHPLLYRTARNCLFRLNAETAHEVTLSGLRIAEQTGILSLLAGPYPEDPFELMGLKFPNRIGLAAGLDKEANTIEALGRLGFGFVEVGTLTPRPQPGNDKPRLFRLIPHQAFINRMGFNNSGIVSGVEHIRKARARGKYKGVIGVNIGKNKVTPNEDAAKDYLACLKEAWSVADYISVNFSSPNTPGLRDLQQADAAARLLASLKAEQTNLASETNRNVPLLIKVAPDLTDEQIPELAKVFLNEGLDGVIATNTTLERKGVEGHRWDNQAGGLSGAPLTRRSTEVLQAFAAELGGKIPLVASGGVMTPQDAVDKIQAGASLVQLYTGFVYSGPPLIAACSEALRTQCPVSSATQS